MPRMTVNDLVKDPKFWDLSQKAQLQVMGKIDSRFSNLSPEAQGMVLRKLTPKTQLPEMPTEAPKEHWGREVARVGGGIVGGLAAGALPEPAKWFTVPTGVAVGAASGDAAYQLAQHAFGDPGAPKTPEEAAKAIGWAGIREGGLEAVGGGIARVGMKILAPLRKTVNPEIVRLTAWMNDRIKPLFTASEMTESKLLDVIQNITEGSILGGMKFEKFKAFRKEFLNDMADDVIALFGKEIGPDEVGELFIDAIENKNKVFKAVANTLYNHATELAKDVTIKSARLKAFGKPLQKLGKELKGIEATNAGDDLIQAVMDLPDEISIDAAKELRSRLLSRVDEFSVLNKKAPAIGKAKQLIKLVDREIEGSLKGEALIRWRSANNFYKTQSEKFNSTLIRRLVKLGEENPQAVSRAIFKPNNFKTISKIKTALSPDEWKSMQSYLMQDTFMQATREATTDASGKIIESTLMGQRIIDRLVGKRTGIGLKSLKTIFSPEQLKEIFNFASVLKIAQRKQSEGLGRMWIQLAQGTAAVTVATGGMGMLGMGDAGDLGTGRLVGAGLIIFGPAILSRMMVRPEAIKYLTKGLKVPASSPEVLGIVSRLLAASRRVHQEMLKEKEL